MKRKVGKRVREIIKKVSNVGKNQLSQDAHFQNDLGMKSITLIELIGNLEEQFDIEIPMKEARKNQTVGQVIEYIKRKVGEND